jgi:hypothetical protein
MAMAEGRHAGKKAFPSEERDGAESNVPVGEARIASPVPTAWASLALFPAIEQSHRPDGETATRLFRAVDVSV